jgi:zinc protease
VRRLSLAAVLVTATACTHERPLRFPTGLDPGASFHYHIDLDVLRVNNGLTVVLAPSADTNLVVVDTRYETGAADDPEGQTGIAHFVEHLTFLERPAADQPTIGEHLGEAALTYNASTAWDETHYTETALAGRWPELLDIEAARMSGGCDAIDPALFERERAVVAQEIDQRQSTLLDALLAALFGDHPYGHTPGGTDIAKITRQDVCAFLDAHYAPDRAIMVISGAVDKRAMRAAVTARFGAIHRRATSPRHETPPVTELPGPEVQIIRGDVDAPIEIFAWPAPAWGTNQAMYQSVSELVIGNDLSALEKRKDVTDTGVFELGGHHGGATLVYATTTTGADFAAIDKAIHERLEHVLEPGSGSWMTPLRAYLYDGLVDRYEDLSQRGAMCADYLQYTQGTSFQIHDLGVAHAMTAPKLLAYADHYLVNTRPHILRILPRKSKAKTTSIAAAIPTHTLDLPPSKIAVDDAEADAILTAPVPSVEGRTSGIHLDNGLHVVFAPRPGSALFEARMVFPAGSADDPPDRPGEAWLAAEALEFDFHRDRPWRVLNQLRAGYTTGTVVSFSVTENSTTFSTHGIAAWAMWHLWRLNMELEATEYLKKDVAATQRHDDETAKAAAERARNRRRRRLIAAKLYGPHHPYVAPAKDVTLSVGDLARYRAAHYVTDGATLIISGQFDRDVIEKEVGELFGAWPRRAQRDVHTVPPAHPARGPTVLADGTAPGPQDHVHLAFLARSTYVASAPVRLVAVELMDERLAAIRDEMAASYGVYAHYTTTAAGDLVQVDGDVDASQAGAVIARITAELDRLRGHAAELRADFIRARRSALGAALARAGSAVAAADEIEALVAHDLPPDHFARLPAEVGKVTPADVGTLLARDLDPARMVVVVSGPGAEAAAEAAKLGPVKELPK